MTEEQRISNPDEESKVLVKSMEVIHHKRTVPELFKKLSFLTDDSGKPLVIGIIHITITTKALDICQLQPII